MKKHKGIKLMLLTFGMTFMAGLLFFLSSLGAQASAGGTVDPDEETRNFLLLIRQAAITAAEENDLYPSVVIAQAIVASNYGKSDLAKSPVNNIFSLKGRYNGASVTQTYNGVATEFRKYPSIKAAVKDYLSLMKNGNEIAADYYKKTWRSNTSSYKDATKALGERYAETSQYEVLLNEVINDYDLTSYDQTALKADAKKKKKADNSTEVTDESGEKSQKISRHIVKNNENLADIAEEYDISELDIIRLNRMSSGYIVTGQALQIE